MSQRFSLKATSRPLDGTSNTHRLRKTGEVPAVMYGKGFENQNLQVNGKELSAVLHATTSENVLVELEISGKKQLTVVKSVQHNSLTSEPVHVDFHAVREDQRIIARVPVELTGEAVGVKTGGGLLQFQTQRLTITCLPKDLPEKVVADITTLNVNESLHVSGLKLPEGVKARTAGEVVIVAIMEQEAAPEPVAKAVDKKAAKKAAKKA
jgi:large subunit ribosomal protein L25